MKNVPTLEERRIAWINAPGYDEDELKLISSADVYPDSAASDSEKVSRIAGICRYKMREGLRREIEVSDDDLLLDGVSEEFPGDECVLKGVKRPNDNTLWFIREDLEKKRNMKTLKSVGGREPIFRCENGRTLPKTDEEADKSLVATKERTKWYPQAWYKRLDHHVERHKGKADCRNYGNEIPSVGGVTVAVKDQKDLSREEIGGVWMGDHFVPDNTSAREIATANPGIEPVSITETEISRLKREVDLYKGFLAEYNLGKLYDAWLLSANGKEGSK